MLRKMKVAFFSEMAGQWTPLGSFSYGKLGTGVFGGLFCVGILTKIF